MDRQEVEELALIVVFVIFIEKLCHLEKEEVTGRLSKKKKCAN